MSISREHTYAVSVVHITEDKEDDMDKERLWTKDFVLIASINFLIYMVFYLLMVIIAAYAVDKFHASTGIAGLVSGIFIIGILIGRLMAGRIVEDVGSRKILIAGTLFFIVTSASYFAASCGRSSCAQDPCSQSSSALRSECPMFTALRE